MSNWIRPLFLFSALYDLVIGLVFLLFGKQLFDWASVPHPNHWAYIYFGALLLVIFGLMFFAIAWHPVENRNLIPFGIMLKIAYCGIAFYYWYQTNIPLLFKPFAIIDLAMIGGFGVAAIQLRGRANSGNSQTDK